MLDRDELIAHFEWLSGSKYYDQPLGEAALAIELCAGGHDWELMRYRTALMTAGGVVGVFGLLAAAVVAGCFVVCFALAVLGYDPQRGMIGRVQRPA